MGQDSVLRFAKRRLLSGILDNISESNAETLSILADVDQMTDLMTSLLEVGSGKVVALQNAFADLQ